MKKKIFRRIAKCAICTDRTNGRKGTWVGRKAYRKGAEHEATTGHFVSYQSKIGEETHLLF